MAINSIGLRLPLDGWPHLPYAWAGPDLKGQTNTGLDLEKQTESLGRQRWRTARRPKWSAQVQRLILSTEGSIGAEYTNIVC